MSPPIRDGSGDSIGAIRLGDGSEISEVRTGAGDVLFSGSAIPDSALTQDLVAWYRFEDGDARDYASSGEFPSVTWGDSTAFDGTVNGATFQSNGGVTDFETGGNSGAFDFDGNDDDIDLSALVGVVSDPLTVSMWIRYEGGGAWFLYVNSLSAGNFSDRMYADIDNINSGLNVRVNDNSWTESISSINTNEWYHFVYVADGSELKIYLNNTQIHSEAYSGSTQPTSFFSIGYEEFANNRHLDGQMDDFRLYNRELTASEISDIYNATEP